MNENLLTKTLSEKDWQLITGALMGHTVTITSTCMTCKSVMSDETYNKEMNESERLVYLVNVLQGRMEYSELSDSEKLELINEMVFIEDDADGENCSEVFVEDNQNNRGIIHKIGFDDEYIDKQLIGDEGQINIAIIAFKYANWWTGEYFIEITCDTCGIEMTQPEYEQNGGFCENCSSDMAE